MQTVKLSFGVASCLCGANGQQQGGERGSGCSSWGGRPQGEIKKPLREISGGGGFTRSGLDPGNHTIRFWKVLNQIRESTTTDFEILRVGSGRA